MASIVEVPRSLGLTPERNTRSEVFAASVYSDDVFTAHDDDLDAQYGAIYVAGTHLFNTSRVLRLTSPADYRVSVAEFRSREYDEVDPDDFPETHCTRDAGDNAAWKVCQVHGAFPVWLGECPGPE